ncbi:BTAD domain-containing putative transcriptional regulator [Amycolatopsis sp. A133]|uniref:AfsR/SARP family transcriptional regulator n=1 Tax=Amycolatopsis sp. A133 TaxID=3064472 RepID=UPI0027ECA69C|nr:BTAD domain-containing putative transcriptional regulator [Amycolatopsis sp. A133]MDQ7809129.1 BTAD domain-containing putative transcriptional regulator [Amycolatopsis sp. A133]
MRFSVLGPLAIYHDGEPVEMTTAKLRVLLVTLLLSANRPVPMSSLLDRLWDRSPPADQSKAARLYVTRLRAALGPARNLVRTVPGGYQIDVRPDQLDLLRFEQLVAEADTTDDCSARAETLGAALALWRGDPCPDVASDVLRSDDLSRLTERRLLVEEQYADLGLALGRHSELVPRLRGLVAQTSLRERLWAQLVLALHGSGRRAEALDAYRTIAAQLAEELGVDPGEELRAAQQAVLTDGLPEAATNGDGSRPRQLPADLARFTGRGGYLAQLDRYILDSDVPVTLVAVDGPAGVGKTSLVLHWAHQRADRFPDGQLFVDLRGGQRSANDVLGSFLRALGQPADRIPVDLDERAGLFRSVTADRQLLVVLDNADDAAQVRPLMPGPGGVAMVTSRRRLRGLSVRNGAERLALAPFGREEAIELLSRIAGPARIAAARDATATLTDHCGRLALPLVIMAERLADGTPVDQLLHDLGDERKRLDAFAVTSDAETDLRVTLGSAYAALPAAAARLFRLLGTWPGHRVGASAAAALAGIDKSATLQLLHTLADAHHLRQVGPGRYELHDLLRAFAVELFAAEPDDEALSRMLSWCLHSAYNAARRLEDHRPLRPPPLEPGVAPIEPATEQQAIGWFGTELDNLIAAVALAAERGRNDYAWQIVATFNEFRERKLRWADHTGVINIALTAVRSTGDLRGQALMSTTLANNQQHLGRYTEALANYRRSLDQCRELGDDVGEGLALGNIGRSLYRLGRHEDASTHWQHSLAVHRRLGRRGSEAQDLHNMAMCRLDAGHPAEAIALDEQALELQLAQGDRFGAALVHGQLGEAHLALGRHVTAVTHLRTALTMLQDGGGSVYEADAMSMLAIALQHAGERGEATALAREAARRLHADGAPATKKLLAMLRAVFAPPIIDTGRPVSSAKPYSEPGPRK